LFKTNRIHREFMLFVLNDTDSVANHILAELRDSSGHHNSYKFRKNMERLGEILAYELSKSLRYGKSKVNTPLGEAGVKLIVDDLVIITILRAGVPFFQGVLNVFENAKGGFVGSYRDYKDNSHEFSIEMGYLSLPETNGKVVIIVDPMLATGQSMVQALDEIQKRGAPDFIHIISAISAPEGIALVKQHIGSNYKIWTGALDEKLNDKYYIVPGLGDAGDISYGNKD